MRGSAVRNLRRAGNDEHDCMEFPGTRRGGSLTATTLLMRMISDGRWISSRNTSASRSNGSGKSSPFDTLDELSQNKHKMAIFLGTANLIFQARTFDWAFSVRGNSLLDNENDLAERVGFEPTLPFRVNLISSQAPSAGLGHLSGSRDLFCSLTELKNSLRTVAHSFARTPPVAGTWWLSRRSLHS